jgi:hypothetical protein
MKTELKELKIQFQRSNSSNWQYRPCNKMNGSLISVQDIYDRLVKYVTISEGQSKKNLPTDIWMLSSVIKKYVMHELRKWVCRSLLVDESAWISVNQLFTS